jgi:hypothetical protein
MKRIHLIWLFVVSCCYLFTGCPHACSDKEVVVSLINETKDTLYLHMACITEAPPWGELEEVIPLARIDVCGFFDSDIEDAGWLVYGARKKTIDENGMDSVIKNRWYDFVLRYTWSDLENRGRVIVLHDSDLDAYNVFNGTNVNSP